MIMRIKACTKLSSARTGFKEEAVGMVISANLHMERMNLSEKTPLSTSTKKNYANNIVPKVYVLMARDASLYINRLRLATLESVKPG